MKKIVIIGPGEDTEAKLRLADELRRQGHEVVVQGGPGFPDLEALGGDVHVDLEREIGAIVSESDCVVEVRSHASSLNAWTKAERELARARGIPVLTAESRDAERGEVDLREVESIQPRSAQAQATMDYWSGPPVVRPDHQEPAAHLARALQNDPVWVASERRHGELVEEAQRTGLWGAVREHDEQIARELWRRADPRERKIIDALGRHGAALTDFVRDKQRG